MAARTGQAGIFSRLGWPRPPRTLRILGRLSIGLAAFSVLATAGAGWYLHTSVFGGLASSNALFGLSRPTQAGADQNILLMGLDSRRDLDGNDLAPAVLAQLHAGSSSDVGGYNTNTLILLHVPADGSGAVALSIPRDDYVNLPEGLGKHKIKEAYGRSKAAAETAAAKTGVTDTTHLEQIGREAGRRAAVEAVEDFLNVPVDHFVEINLAGFADLAGALGGVDVCLREPVNDSYSGADFSAGVHTLNGPQALAFVRQRHGLPNGDLDRTRRQQAFLSGAVAKLRSDGVFDDLGKINGLLAVARKDVVVDSGFDLLTFMQQATSVTSGDIRFFTLPVKGFATVDGEAVNLVDQPALEALTRQLLSDSPAEGATSTASAAASGLAEAPAADAKVVSTAAPHGVRKISGSASAPSGVEVRATAAAVPSPTFDPPPGVPCVN
ncbi:MAG TPA: LCP family protein [Actinocrinis sp.]|nr:LCP family protein [Actinocrinis sp.]